MKCSRCGDETEGIYKDGATFIPVCSECDFIEWLGKNNAKKNMDTERTFHIYKCPVCNGSYKAKEDNGNDSCPLCGNEINSNTGEEPGKK